MQQREIKTPATPVRAVLESEVKPWGGWSVLNQGPGYKVKLVAVTPGKRLGLQYHNLRSEHWVVVAGKARIVVGDEILELEVLESAVIPAATVHRIENPYPETLILVEVQEGVELVEDDVVKLDDDYRRAKIVRRMAK